MKSGAVWWCGEPEPDSTDCKTGSFAYQRHNQHLANRQTHNARVRKPQHTPDHTLSHTQAHMHKLSPQKPCSWTKGQADNNRIALLTCSICQSSTGFEFACGRTRCDAALLVAPRQEQVSLAPRLFLPRSCQPQLDPQIGTTSWWRLDDSSATRCEIMSLALVLIGTPCPACKWPTWNRIQVTKNATNRVAYDISLLFGNAHTCPIATAQ